MHRSLPALLPAILILGGCGAGSGTMTRPLPGLPAAPRAATPAASALVGADARSLSRQFGKPRLDIRDPTAHKLQYANDRCVLDVYLYPPGENREPLVTFAEARSPQGTAVDTGACAKTLREAK